MGSGGTSPPLTPAGRDTSALGVRPSPGERGSVGTSVDLREAAGGALVKECRYQRPTPSRNDPPSVQGEKGKILRLVRDSSFRRTPVDPVGADAGPLWLAVVGILLDL